MSLYNAMNGFNPACLLIMPMLGRQQDEYPHFKDCFVTEEKNIAIFTRVGGKNRNCGYGEEKLYSDKNFLTTYDHDFDSTYATYEFKVPKKWKTDFDKIICGDFESVSTKYIKYLKRFYSKLAEHGLLEKIFNKQEENTNESN